MVVIERKGEVERVLGRREAEVRVPEEEEVNRSLTELALALLPLLSVTFAAAPPPVPVPVLSPSPTLLNIIVIGVVKLPIAACVAACVSVAMLTVKLGFQAGSCGDRHNSPSRRGRCCCSLGRGRSCTRSKSCQRGRIGVWEGGGRGRGRVRGGCRRVRIRGDACWRRTLWRD